MFVAIFFSATLCGGPPASCGMCVGPPAPASCWRRCVWGPTSVVMVIQCRYINRWYALRLVTLVSLLSHSCSCLAHGVSLFFASRSAVPMTGAVFAGLSTMTLLPAANRRIFKRTWACVAGNVARRYSTSLLVPDDFTLSLMLCCVKYLHESPNCE